MTPSHFLRYNTTKTTLHVKQFYEGHEDDY